MSGVFCGSCRHVWSTTGANIGRYLKTVLEDDRNCLHTLFEIMLGCNVDSIEACENTTDSVVAGVNALIVRSSAESGMENKEEMQDVTRRPHDSDRPKFL